MKTWDNFNKACRDKEDFSSLDDFGEVMSQSIIEWYSNTPKLLDGLIVELEILEEENETKSTTDNFISGKTFVVTGSFNTMKRSEIEKIITDMGGKLTGSVSKKTDYLLTNDGNSGSSKALKAKELGIPIMDEETFLSKTMTKSH